MEQKYKILIVEDNAKNLSNADYAFKDSSHSFFYARDYENARRLFDEINPDLVITDMNFYEFPFSKTDKFMGIYPGVSEELINDLRKKISENKGLVEKIVDFESKNCYVGILKNKSLGEDLELRYGIKSDSSDEEMKKYSKENAQKKLDYLISDALKPGRKGVPLGYYIIEESKKKNMPHAVITSVNGHGLGGLIYAAIAGALSEEELLKILKADKEYYTLDNFLKNFDIKIPYTNTIICGSEKTKEDWNRALELILKNKI